MEKSVTAKEWNLESIDIMIERNSNIQKALIFLLEGPKTKSEIAKFVYGSDDTWNISRFNRDVLDKKNYKNLFEIKDGVKAWKENYLVKPDKRVKMVFVNWNKLLNIWESSIPLFPMEKNIRYSVEDSKQLKNLIKDNARFLFHFESLEKLFIIEESGEKHWCFPSLRGLISTMLFYAFCIGTNLPRTSEQPVYLQGKYMEYENIRGLFKIYHMMRISEIMGSFTPFLDLQKIVDSKEEIFLNERKNLKKLIYNEKWIEKESSECGEDFQKMLKSKSEDEIRDYLFSIRIRNVIFNKFIWIMAPDVIRIDKNQRWNGFYKLLNEGIVIERPLKYFQYLFEKENKKQKTIESVFAKGLPDKWFTKEQYENLKRFKINTKSHKDAPIEFKISLEELLPVLGPMLELRSCFD